MATDKSASWVHIVVAVITVAGGIAVALITTNAYNNREATPAIQAVGEVQQVPPQVSPSSVAITGVLIGKTGAETSVSEVITQFAPHDEIAITVRYVAAERVENFPVRLSARVFSGFGNGVEEQVSDVSRPGNSFWTFRFKSQDGWIGEQFVSIEIDGHKAYSQVLTISGD